MRVIIEGKIYDSTITPILIEFDVNEQSMFNGMKRFVSAPGNYTEEQRQKLMDLKINE